MSDITMDAPEHFICPLTLEVMKDPLKNTTTGQSFEAASIRSWMFIEGKGTCPLTRQPIGPSDFVENNALKFAIQQWKNENQIEDHEEDDDDDDDDEIFIEALASAKKIQELTTRGRSSSGNGSLRSLADLGSKILQQRDAKISQFVSTRRPSQNQTFMPREVESIFELYQ